MRLKYLGRGFLALVFMIGTLRSGGRLGSSVVWSTTDHPAILYFKRILAGGTIIYHIRIRLPPPDTCWKRTSIDMERETSVNRLTNSSFGKNSSSSLFCNCIVNPLLVGTGLDHQFFQILPRKVARGC